MQRTMTIKGFLIILALILAVFLVLHLTMKGDLSRKAEQENAMKIALRIGIALQKPTML